MCVRERETETGRDRQTEIDIFDKILDAFKIKSIVVMCILPPSQNTHHSS